jgi:hypothetical protein
MISKSHADAIPLPETADTGFLSVVQPELPSNHQPSRIAFFVESLRLYDIMNDILMELYTNTENTTAKDQPGVAAQQTDHESTDLTTILKLDQALMLWGRSLPPHLRISSLESMENVTFQMQSIVCRARWVDKLNVGLGLNNCILQVSPRPHFAFQTCPFSILSLRNHATPSCTALDESLGYRMITQCSSLCVKAAHDVIQLIHSNLNQDELTGPLPAWWYSILCMLVS